MRSLPKRWISLPLKPLLNCLLRGMACLKQLVSAMEVHITSKEHFHTGKCNTFQFEAEEVGRPHKETLKERQYLARCFRAQYCCVPIGAGARFRCGLPASVAFCMATHPHECNFSHPFPQKPAIFMKNPPSLLYDMTKIAFFCKKFCEICVRIHSFML